MDLELLEPEERKELAELTELLAKLLLTDRVVDRTIEVVRKRAARKQEPIEVPQMPMYTAPDDPNDLLGFEFGLELAFRPERNPNTISPRELVPLLYTGIPERLNRWRSGNSNSPLYVMYNEVANTLAAQCGAKHGNTNMSTCSGTEIEFPSPIMTKLSQIEWYYGLIRKLADAIDAKVENKKMNSGGGHIHVTPKKGRWSDWDKYAMIMACCEQPWLGWVFNDPDDETTARCPNLTITRSLVDLSYANRSRARHGRRIDVPEWWASCAFEGESTMVRPNGQLHATTMEFRMFQAPKDLEEQLLHVKFLDRWLKKVLAPKGDEIPEQMPPMKYMFPQDLQAITFEQAKAGFNAELESIALVPADYARFVERNMKVRYDKNWART